MMLHLGCGKRYIQGFIHVDLADWPHIDYRNSVDDLSMFEDSSADLIYSSHVFEYFDRQKAPSVLAEWRRVLISGGILRLAVPDFQALVQVYAESGDLNKILGPLFGRIMVESGDSEIQHIYHRTVYDYFSLKSMLEENGFIDIRKYNWRKTLHKDYDDYSQAYYPHMEKEKGLLISLNLEAKKG